MSALPKVKIPFRRRWEHFRLKFLPILMFGFSVVAIGLLWQAESTFTAHSITGEVEALVSEVISPDAGILGQLSLQPYAEVEAGEVVGKVMRTPPDVLHASLAVLKAEIELTRLGLVDPLVDIQRNNLQLEGLRLDVLEKEASLAIYEIELQQARRELDRLERLFDLRSVSQDEYEQALSRVEVLSKTIEKEEGLVVELGESLERLKRQRGDEPFGPEALNASLVLHEERLRLLQAELRPIDLVAAVSGRVMKIHRHNGQHVQRGEPVLTIHSPEAERIVAYLRQPYRVEPEVGMKVQLKQRNLRKASGVGVIAVVGPQFQPMEEPFLRPGGGRFESGRPLVIRIPDGLRLGPGELVDVVLMP